ncbi:DNA polymerase III subunit gamma/tau, partial [Desulfovibrio oxamicus]
MSNAPLTARYRPQTFAEVAGQETVKAILSRAAAEDRVAPAYLFSGTRGVGKTTIARILAKALNCEKAPTGEPCNTCEQCRKVVMGNHVDVVEIDGASNRGIEDARRLREAIGYAPMEGRYKVFIIDEAHMLTREAFNALLKTLEEPPPRVTFVLATTEPHKFPVTIISRCQHFTFKRLPEHELEAHLTGVLTREGQDFDPAAVRLIARRAAGSVRDSMSLLGQVLALGGDRLTVEGARGVLGLAGQELFFEVMQALASQDCVAVSAVVRDLLDKGVDIGFFLRELAATWRNLFMLRQAGEAALPALDLPEEEARQWLEWAPKFEITHIHACWQMTLEGQRRVLTSLEPAMALELLLLNLAMLPRLVSLEQLSRGGGAGPAGGRGVPGGVGG